MKNIKIGKLDCCCAIVADSSIVNYLLTPIPLDNANLDELSKRYGQSVIAISGMDWNNDMTPWEAPGVMRSEADFAGDAPTFLHSLCSDVIPQIESELKTDSPVTRSLIGISLSGLFAVWAWMQNDMFNDIASLSGSFWYDGFTDWLADFNIPEKQGSAYFSLGSKEGGQRGNPRFRNIPADTSEVVKILEEHNISTMFERTDGSHHAPLYPRLSKALAGLQELRKNH